MQYPARSTFGFTCRVIFCVSACASFLIQGQEVRQAIRPAFGDVPDLAANRRPHVRRVRAISVDLGLFDKSAASRFHHGDRVTFPLFPDANVSVELQSVEVAPEDERVTWIGHVEGTRFGELVLVKTGDALSANISTDSGPIYQLRGSEHGWVAKEIDPSRVPAGAPPRTPPRSSEKLAVPAERQVAADDGSTIDVMVVYTPAVRAAEGGTAAIQNEVDLAVATANQVYVNSGIIQRVRLVYKGETNYTESGSFDTDLTRLQNPSDGYLDDVQQLRNQYGADLVSLWIDHGDVGVGGLGFIMLDTSGFAAYADSVVLRDAVDSVYAFVHEMGHNMGAAHDRAHANGQGLYSYSYGYEQMARSPQFRTVMAYPCPTVNCPVIGYFSNPNVQYSGIPTGVPAGSSGESDNWLTLNNSRVAVANFRQSIQTGGSPPLSISLNPPSVTVSSSGGSGVITVTANGNWAVTGLPSWISVSGAASGSGSGILSYSITPNTGTSARSTSVTIGTATFTFSEAGNNILSISLNPPGATIPFTGGSGSVSITANGSWTVSNVPSWITIDNASNGSGAATLTYTVSANSSTSSRVGSVTIGTTTFTVTQAATPAIIPAYLLNPVPGSVLSGDTISFSWSASSSASDYWLDVGNSFGHGDIYASAQGASTLSRTVAGLPTDGRTIYVRLWTQVGGVWQFHSDYTFTAANEARANLLSPSPGDTFGSGTVNFVWSTVPTATNYWLDVGSTPGHGDLYASAQGTLNSRTVPNLPIDGRTIYVRLWTYIGSWQTPIDYILTACWSNCNDQALLLTPASGSAITSANSIFSWTPVSGASNYWLDVGDYVGVGDFYAGAQGSGTTQRAVAGLPTDGRTIYARLWTQVAGTWINHTDYAFTACSGACNRRCSGWPPNPASRFCFVLNRNFHMVSWNRCHEVLARCRHRPRSRQSLRWRSGPCNTTHRKRNSGGESNLGPAVDLLQRCVAHTD